MSDSFEKILDILRQKVSEKNFSEKKISDSEIEFLNETSSFKILWKNSNVILSSNDKKLCEWHLDENLKSKEISIISDEFCEFILGKKNKNIEKLKESPEEISDVSFDKMVEKVLQFFSEDRNQYESEMKDAKISEKISFLRHNIIQKINEMVKKSKSDNKTERLMKHLSNSYIFGDESTKCVVSMLFFNGIEGSEERKKVRKMIPHYLRRTWEASWAMKR